MSEQVQPLGTSSKATLEFLSLSRGIQEAALRMMRLHGGYVIVMGDYGLPEVLAPHDPRAATEIKTHPLYGQ